MAQRTGSKTLRRLAAPRKDHELVEVVYRMITSSTSCCASRALLLPSFTMRLIVFGASSRLPDHVVNRRTPILEAITRNVRWILADSPELEVLENGTSDYRLQKTFLKSRTSLGLIIFQIAFLDIFIKTYAGAGVKRLDEIMGSPKRISGRTVKEVKAIYGVVTWSGFFERVRYVRGLSFDKEKMSELLRAAVHKSSQKGYHTPTLPTELHIWERIGTTSRRNGLRQKRPDYAESVSILSGLWEI
ncbi:hypothetical protein H2248_007489 [Termitomyces sp. 'cryptogamus']|nr:hypothetical protein H2248_007489 [Termitomyces sp. 'cryptogamus']